jgi:hypothetical protein
MEDRVLEYDSPFDGRLATVRANPRAESVVELFRNAVGRHGYAWRRIRKVCVSESRQ